MPPDYNGLEGSYRPAGRP